MANTGVRVPTLDEMGPLEIASKAGGFLASIFNFMGSDDFSEIDRQNMRDWEQLREDIPILTVDRIKSPVILTLMKLAVKGVKSAFQELQYIRAKFPADAVAQWDEALDEIKEIADRGFTIGDDAMLQKIASSAEGALHANREAIDEQARRQGMGGRGALTREAALGTGQGVSSTLADQGLGVLNMAMRRKDDARMAHAAGLQNKTTMLAGFASNEAAAHNRFNLGVAGGLASERQFNASTQNRAAEMEWIQAHKAQQANEIAKYTEQVRQAQQGDAQQKSMWDMNRMATAGITDARRGLQRTQAQGQAADEDFWRGFGEGAPVAREALGGLFDRPEGGGADAPVYEGYGDYEGDGGGTQLDTLGGDYDDDVVGGGGGSGSLGFPEQAGQPPPPGGGGAYPPPRRRRRRR